MRIVRKGRKRWFIVKIVDLERWQPYCFRPRLLPFFYNVYVYGEKSPMSLENSYNGDFDVEKPFLAFRHFFSSLLFLSPFCKRCGLLFLANFSGLFHYQLWRFYAFSMSSRSICLCVPSFSHSISFFIHLLQFCFYLFHFSTVSLPLFPFTFVLLFFFFLFNVLRFSKHFCLFSSLSLSSDFVGFQ